MNDSDLLKSALMYAEKGWPIIPLHNPTETGCSCKKPECKSIGKHPRTIHGIKEASKDPATIKKWWDEWPVANIGIVTGKKSGLVVLDIDPRHDGEHSLEQIEAKYGKLPDTVKSLTGGGGKHYFFSHPGQEYQVKNSVNLGGLSGLDVRGDGGYIVAPPSLHSSGKIYLWEFPSKFDQIQIAPFPKFLMEILYQPHNSIKTINDSIPEGTRNNTLTSLAGTMRNRGMSQESILSALLIENRNCSPLLEESEIKRIVESIMNYSPEQTENLTDSGNARRLVTLFGHKLKYVNAWGKWLIYDGKRWEKDGTGQIQQLAKETVKTIYLEASQEPNEEKESA